MVDFLKPGPSLDAAQVARTTEQTGVGGQIRTWRGLRKLSQMDLALDVGISPRHQSFIETGRSKPSVQVLMAIAEHLDVPLRVRNTWLLQAGYAPRYSEDGLDEARMAQVKSAIQRLLDTHNPYPGVALDRLWNIVLFNEGAVGLIDLLPPSLRAAPINVFRASLHPDGFARVTSNFAEWGLYLVRLINRLKLTTRDEQLIALANEINHYPNIQAMRAQELSTPPSQPELLIPCKLEIAGQQLSLFTTLTTFGSPQDITLHELCIELFYPSDASTQAFFEQSR